MKTKKTTIGIFILLATLASGNAAIAAVSVKTRQIHDSQAPVQANSLLGKWLLTDIRAFDKNGNELEGDGPGDVYYTFKSNNTVVIEGEGEQDVYQYEIKNGKLDIDGDNFISSIEKASIKRKDNILELQTVNEEGIKYIFYLEKAQ